MTNGVGMLPSCWGSSFWHVCHSIAYVYNPSVDKEKYFAFFANLGHILPCEECRVHYSQNLNKQELISALETNDTLFRWVYDLHNKINRQLGVPESKWPSYESIKQRYGSFKASCSEIPGVCASKSGIQRKVKMVEQFGPVSDEQMPLLASTVSLGVLLLVAVVYIVYLKRHKNPVKGFSR